MDVRSRWFRGRKGVGVERDVRGLERRERDCKPGRSVRGSKEVRDGKRLKAKLRFLRWGFGRGVGMVERALEARERVTKEGKVLVKRTIFMEMLVCWILGKNGEGGCLHYPR